VVFSSFTLSNVWCIFTGLHRAHSARIVAVSRSWSWWCGYSFLGSFSTYEGKPATVVCFHCGNVAYGSFSRTRMLWRCHFEMLLQMQSTWHMCEKRRLNVNASNGWNRKSIQLTLDASPRLTTRRLCLLSAWRDFGNIFGACKLIERESRLMCIFSRPTHGSLNLSHKLCCTLFMIVLFMYAHVVYFAVVLRGSMHVRLRQRNMHGLVSRVDLCNCWFHVSWCSKGDVSLQHIDVWTTSAPLYRYIYRC
jgi:hypothetical protein